MLPPKRKTGSGMFLLPAYPTFFTFFEHHKYSALGTCIQTQKICRKSTRVHSMSRQVSWFEAGYEQHYEAQYVSNHA